MTVTFSTPQVLPANSRTLRISGIDGFTGTMAIQLAIYNPVGNNSLFQIGGIIFSDSSLPISDYVLKFPAVGNANGGDAGNENGANFLIDALALNVGKYGWIEYTIDGGVTWQGIGDALSTISGSIPAQNTATFLITDNTTVSYTTPKSLATTATTIPVSNFTGYSGNVYFRIESVSSSTTHAFIYSTPVVSSSSLTLAASNFWTENDAYTITGNSNLPLSLLNENGFYTSLEYSTDGFTYYGFGTPTYFNQFTPPIPTENTATFLVSSSSPPCFLKGSLILCIVNGVETYIPVEDLKKGTLVKTLYGVKALECLGCSPIENPGTSERIPERLYKLSPSAYPELTQDLFLTGAHSILVDTLSEKEREGITNHLGRIFVTDQRYRLTAYVDERAEPWASEGSYTVYHFALENENPKMNYGVYANGLLVETCTISYLTTKSNMTIL